MAEAGDILQLTIVTELEGVAMRNTIYWALVTQGTAPSLAVVAGLFGDEFIVASQAVVTTQLNYVAFIVDNLSRNEVRGIVTSPDSGNALGDSHPQDNVLRFNEWAPNADKSAIHRGAFNLSGVAESFSADGRVIDPSQFQSISLFLSVQFLDSPSGFTATPQIRRRIPLSVPPLYEFFRISKADVNPTFFKLKSRKTTVLGL